MAKPIEGYDHARICSDAQAINATPEGQRFFAYIMASASMFQPIDASDPIEMAKAIGARNLAVMIATYAGYQPEDFIPRAIEATQVLKGYQPA
jgi:hypothetical protein